VACAVVLASPALPLRAVSWFRYATSVGLLELERLLNKGSSNLFFVAAEVVYFPLVLSKFVFFVTLVAVSVRTRFERVG